MWIKPFSADGQRYVYSAWNNQIARVSPRLYELFVNGAPDHVRPIATSLGLLPDGASSIDVLPDEMIANDLAELERTGPAHLVLTVTEACNFRCRYCAYSGSYPYARRHSDTSMSEETALKAVGWYFGFSRAHYHIGFYGGEPLLRRGLLEMVVKAARERLPDGAGLSFGLTTNGWLLDDASARFLAENCVDVFISLDGPPAVHDRYRVTVKGKPTFDRVWAGVKRIRRLYPDYFERHVNFSFTLAPPTALAEIDELIDKNPDIFGGKVPKIGMLNGSPSSVLESLGVALDQRRIDLSAVRKRYLERMTADQTPDGLSRACTEASMARIHRRNMTAVAPLKTSAGQCTPGTRCHVTPDGRLLMCEHGDEHFPIGRAETGFDRAAIRAVLERFRDFVQPCCQDCWAVRLCSKCVPNVAEGSTFSIERLAALCAARRNSLERDLADYCRARSENDRCFDSLAIGHSDGGSAEQQQTRRLMP